MTVTVAMTEDEFSEFLAWKKDRSYYDAEMDGVYAKTELIAKKVLWALNKDPAKPGKVKIIDQDHAEELIEMASEYLT